MERKKGEGKKNNRKQKREIKTKCFITRKKVEAGVWNWRT